LLLWFGKPDGPCNLQGLKAACKSQAHKNLQGPGATEPCESSPSRHEFDSIGRRVQASTGKTDSSE
jgi:hypothetical protein